MVGKMFVFISIFAIAVSAKTVPMQSKSSAGTCGVPKLVSGLVINGRNFERGDFPWIVALIRIKQESAQYHGGGTLISSSFVVSGEKLERFDSLNKI